MLRQTLQTEAVKRLVDTCFTKYPDGLVTNVQKGQVPAQYQSLARYVAKYVVSPPIAVRRIDRYDGHRVTYHYRSHRTEREEHETVDVETFIGRMVQHTVPKGFKRIRYSAITPVRNEPAPDQRAEVEESARRALYAESFIVFPEDKSLYVCLLSN